MEFRGKKENVEFRKKKENTEFGKKIKWNLEKNLTDFKGPINPHFPCLFCHHLTSKLRMDNKPVKVQVTNQIYSWNEKEAYMHGT